MNEIWLISDTHFFHNKDFIWKIRGFNNINEMNEKIIENWNSLIKEDDIVYHLGDIYLGTDDLTSVYNLLKSLKGRKYLAYGNHDTDNKIIFLKQNDLFKEINMGYRFRVGKKTLILSHYPQLVANKDDKKPIWSIHGHTHSIDKFSDVFHTYNVNVDAHDCKPVNLEEIISDINKLNSFNLYK